MKNQKGKYVDGYVIVIPKKNLESYKKMATVGAKVWMKYGALDYKECVIEDAKPAHVVLPFGKLAKAGKNDTIVFSYILYKNRAHRDTVNKKVMKDRMMDPKEWENKPMPFDMKRMSYGGFEVIVDGK